MFLNFWYSNIDKKARKLLNEWEVNMYSKNIFLTKIPEKKKYEELEKIKNSFSIYEKIFIQLSVICNKTCKIISSIYSSLG
jgi:23S rRNA C2498 (ribose-2'-O)-methylase RlmM